MRRTWIWVVLFVLLAATIASLATGWNVVLVQDYRKLVALAREEAPFPALGVVLGTLGFLAALAGSALLFVKALREMRLNQRQSEFIAAVSHELKTPIATLELSASLLKAGGLRPDEEARLWESHGAELGRLKDEVERLLEAARWQASAVAVKAEPVRVEAWLEGSMERWSRILGPGARLEREGQPIPGTALLDRRLLDLMADNLMDNARKFCRGRPEVVLRSSVTPAEGSGPARWKVEVADRGWGFPPDEADRIFKRFFRGRAAAPFSIPGTGLGLYLAAQAGRAMRLRLSGESRGVGSGAVFRIEGDLRAPRESEPRR